MLNKNKVLSLGVSNPFNDTYIESKKQDNDFGFKFFFFFILKIDFHYYSREIIIHSPF